MSSHDVIRALTLDFDLPASPPIDDSTEQSSSGTVGERTFRETVALLDGHEEDPEAGRVEPRQNGSNPS